jgi:hypothetical protein
MATTLPVLPLQVYAAGANQGTASIPDTATTADVKVLRNTWPGTGAANVIQVDVEISMDGGATFNFWMGFTASGGVSTHKEAGVDVVDLSSTVGRALPPGTNRQLRVTQTALVSLSTQLDVVVV